MKPWRTFKRETPKRKISTDSVQIDRTIYDEIQRDARHGQCKWEYCWAECSWDTQCDNKYVFMCDGPKENGYKFCPGCGNQVLIASKRKRKL